MKGQVSPPPRRWPIVALVLVLALAVMWWLRGRQAAPVDAPSDAATAAGSQADLAGAQVCATAESQRLASSDIRRAVCTKTGRDGHYRLEALFPVRHIVVASAAGHIPARFHRGEGVKRREYVDLRVAQDTPGVDIQLEGGGVEIHGARTTRIGPSPCTSSAARRP